MKELELKRKNNKIGIIVSNIMGVILFLVAVYLQAVGHLQTLNVIMAVSFLSWISAIWLGIKKNTIDCKINNLKIKHLAKI